MKLPTSTLYPKPLCLISSRWLAFTGGYAFNGCSGFTGSLTIPNSVTSIVEGTFSRCSGFSNATLGYSVHSIASNAFSNTNLESIISLAKWPPEADYDSFLGISKPSCVVVVPHNSTEQYSIAPGWRDFYYITEQESYVSGVRADIDGNGVVDIDDLNHVINIMLHKE